MWNVTKQYGFQLILEDIPNFYFLTPKEEYVKQYDSLHEKQLDENKSLQSVNVSDPKENAREQII
jgi:hypothetical protein